MTQLPIPAEVWIAIAKKRFFNYFYRKSPMFTALYIKNVDLYQVECSGAPRRGFFTRQKQLFPKL